MSLRGCLLNAMLFTSVAFGAFSGVNTFKAKADVQEPSARLRALVPAAALPWFGSRPASGLNRWLESFSETDELPVAIFAPVQFKNADNLGVGKLLVASRSLRDPSFAQTVVLLVHYDESGVVGLILNRRTHIPLSRVLDLKAAKDRSDPAYLGGPVGLSNVFGLFQSADKMADAEKIFASIYLISDKKLFEQTLSAGPDSDVFHVYLGYAGWTRDQLQAEVHSGAWFVYPADASAVFNSNPDSLWLKMIRKSELKWAKI